MDPRPLVDAADQYVNAKTRYDIPALVMLGGLLIYRAIRPTPEFVMVTDLILRAASRALDKLIQSVILHNPYKAMVCSQLVYQIYDDCSKDYHIHLDGGTFQSVRNEKDSVRLIDLVKNSPKEVRNSCESSEDTAKEAGTSHGNVGDDLEELCRLLWDAMCERGYVENVYNENEMLDAARSLIGPARKLLEQLETFLEKSKADIPIDALFVTPADFVYHAKNLRLIKTVDIVEC